MGEGSGEKVELDGAGSLLDVEFRTLLMGTLGELGGGFNEEIVNMKRDIEVM